MLSQVLIRQGISMKIGKNGFIATFKKANPTILIALVGHGQGDEPFEEGLRGYEEFLCSHFCPHWEANMRGWFLFKQQGVDKLPVTHIAWIEHICAVPTSRLIYGTKI